jgi:hypothetical protein
MSDPHAIDSREAWEEFNRDLPRVVSELLAGKAYSAGSPPKLTGRGVYLFSKGDEHLYVGRTGITTRSRKAEKKPSTSFTARWSQHTAPSSPPHSAPFAMKMAVGHALENGVMVPSELKAAGKTERTAEWWALRKDENPPDFYAVFQEAKRFIREELEFRVLEFVDDFRGVRSHVTEVYVDVVLQTTYGDFSPS